MKDSNRIEKWGIFFIVVIIAGFGTYFYYLLKTDANEKRAATERKESTILAKVSQPDLKTTVKFLTLDEAYTLYHSGQAVFMDARPEQDYGYMHIPGAVSAPYNIAKQLKTVLDLDRNQLIVVYCSSATCPMAEVLATRLHELMFTRVYIFSGGLKEWYNAKYPLERGVETAPKPPHTHP